MKTITALIILSLVSCADYPIAIAVKGERGSASYSAKSGAKISIDATK